MLVLGADPSSSSAGFALSDGHRELRAKDVWKPQKKATRNKALVDYYMHTRALVAMWEPDMVVMTQMMRVRGGKVIRALSYFESATVLAGEMVGVPVYSIDDASARAEVLQVKITADKAEVVKTAKQDFPDIKWSTIRTKKNGDLEGPGLDEIDAFVASLAWEAATHR